MMIPKSKTKAFLLGDLSDRGHSSLKYVSGNGFTEHLPVRQQYRPELDSRPAHCSCRHLSLDCSSSWSLASDLPSPSSGRGTSKIPSVQSLVHLDLLRTDSGNSSLSTVDSASSSASVEPHLDDSFYQIWEDLLLVNVYVPETQSQFDITCSLYQTIWSLKTTLIERNLGLRDSGFNHGLFSFVLGHFLDEQLTFGEYASQLEPTDRSTSAPAVRLEFLYKQRVKYGEVMSTLPLASNTRKKRKRSRLLSAVQNGNLEKVAKALVNCDPNFVDEASGETPLSLASANQSPASATLQQIVVAIVNAGALLDFRTKDGRTALHVAVQKSNFVALKTLLDLGSSPNYVDATGLTPLYYSVIFKANPKLTQLLLYEHATHGITDQHGWQEVHHASKLGLVAHLEQLLFYGCDMNCRIVGSGNTPLHVAAINDQVECARILLLRGCDTSVVNNSHQNAHQVAVIAGNMALAELIRNHTSENVAPYRDKPRYNPARRPPPLPSGSERHEMNGKLGAGQHHLVASRPISPSLSQATNHTTTTSSGVCCDEDEQDDMQKQFQSGANTNGNREALDCEDEEEDEEEEEEKNGVTSSGSEDSGTFAPGMTVRATADYNSGDPSHMQLRRNDQVLLMHSDHSPPTIAFQKLLLGRRVVDGKEGYFPACCVEKIRPNRCQNGDDNERVEGRRDMKLKTVQSATLPTRGRRGARKCLLDKGMTRQYQDRTITLHRGSKGFGFVLRGAKDSSPILTKQLMQQGSSVPLIGLQYFDEIEAGGVADAAGLKRGDFLLAVNDVDVRHMSHEGVVQLIRQSGDKVTMTIATPVPKQLVSILKKKGKSNKSQSQSGSEVTGNGPESLPSSQSQLQMSLSVYGTFGNKGSKAPPPAPPKRDPSTTLSTSRARARSLVVPSEVRSAHNMMLNEAKTAIDQKVPDQNEQYASPDADSMRQQSTKVASIRAHSSRRISSFELNEFISRQPDENKDKAEKEAESSSERTNGVAPDLSLPPPPPPLQDSFKTTLSPPSSPPPSNSVQTSIVKVTLAKQPAGDFANHDGTEPVNRSLTSFQPTRRAFDSNVDKSTENSAVPKIPEPDYSSDEEENKVKSEDQKTGDESTSIKSDTQASSQKKLTTTATVIFKSTSPCPPEPTNGVVESGTGKLFASKNIFDELREQSAKITNSARQRLVNNRQDSEEERKMRRINSQEDSHPVNNVMRNVAELEKRLSISGTAKEAALTRVLSNTTDSNTNLRMSKSCIEELTPNSAILKKDFSTLKSNLRQQHQAANHPDMRRNSAIISAIAEKVAAVNQLVAEQQTSTGSKSLNSSPVPVSMAKLSGQVVTAGSTVVVQKPIALLPTGSSATLTRRCVTVCEDPVKAIHLQQQQHQLRSQLVSSMTTSQPGKPKHSSLAESTSSILKQTTKPLRSQTSVGMPYSPSTESAIDVVPPPPEFAAATPQTTANAQMAMGLRQMVAPQKVYVQRQVGQSSSSPLTIQTSSGHHHHHHHQLVSEMVGQQYGSSGGGHQAQHYHLHHHHANPVSLSSSAPTSDAHALMRSSLMAASVNHPQTQSLHTAYEYTSSQGVPNKITTPAQHSQQHVQNQQTQQQLLYGQQQSAQQSQNQQQLLLQQRALAVANAKLYQQQQQQLRPQSSTGHYNTLSTSKPQQIQYYVATSQNQQHPQYFATLSRHQHAQVQQQYLNSLSSQQQQMQQQQFATLTRHHQQQLQQHLQPMLQQNINYNQLLQQRQAQQIGTTGIAMPANARLVQVQSTTNRQTPPNTVPIAKVAYGTANQMAQYQQYQQQHQAQSGTAAPNSGSYARKSVVEWTSEDVQEWLQRIGMTEHRAKFEAFNGAKMLRLDNNSLANIGVRQQQHRIYLLEKLKQQIWQNHQ